RVRPGACQPTGHGSPGTGHLRAVSQLNVAAPVLPLLHSLLASRRAPDVRARGGTPPRAHDDQDDAQDGENDPHHKHDVADFVNVEPAGRNGYREPQDGTDDYEHNGEPQQPATSIS